MLYDISVGIVGRCMRPRNLYLMKIKHLTTYNPRIEERASATIPAALGEARVKRGQVAFQGTHSRSVIAWTCSAP